jgi:hypothetical protein
MAARLTSQTVLRIRGFLNAIRGLPHAEGASQSTHSRNAANFLTASFAGEAELSEVIHGPLYRVNESAH